MIFSATIIQKNRGRVESYTRGMNSERIRARYEEDGNVVVHYLESFYNGKMAELRLSDTLAELDAKLSAVTTTENEIDLTVLSTHLDESTYTLVQKVEDIVYVKDLDTTSEVGIDTPSYIKTYKMDEQISEIQALVNDVI